MIGIFAKEDLNDQVCVIFGTPVTKPEDYIGGVLDPINVWIIAKCKFLR